MNVRRYLITDAIVSIVNTVRETSSANWNTLERNASSNATWTSLRMIGPGSPPDVGGPRHFCQDYLTAPNNFEALLKFKFPLQR